MNWKVLDICEAKMEPGAKIFMYDKHPSNEKNQLFYLDGQGFIRSSLNDLTIWSPGKGQGIVTAKPSDDPRSQFYFQGNKIGNKAGEYLDIKGENNQEGAEVITWDLNDGDNNTGIKNSSRHVILVLCYWAAEINPSFLSRNRTLHNL